MIRTLEDKNSFLCAAHPTVADLATAAKSALLRENSGAPRLWTCGGGLTAGFSTTTATIEMIQLLRIFSNWITKHTWKQKNRLYKNNHEKCLRRLLTNYDCIECDMANDAWKHWKELVQYVCCLAALGPLKARVASRRRTHHPFEAGSAPTRQPLPERPLDYHDNVTTETVQRLTIAPSHDNLVKRVRINVLIAPIIDQEIGLLLKNWNILWNTETAEIQLQCKTTHTCFEMK